MHALSHRGSSDLLVRLARLAMAGAMAGDMAGEGSCSARERGARERESEDDDDTNSSGPGLDSETTSSSSSAVVQVLPGLSSPLGRPQLRIGRFPV